MLAVENSVSELPNPVAEYQHACRVALYSRQIQVEFYVAVPVDVVVDVRMRLHVLLCVEHEIFLVLAHVRLFLAVETFQPAVLCPVQPELHAPPRVNEVEHLLASTAVEHRPQELE